MRILIAQRSSHRDESRQIRARNGLRPLVWTIFALFLVLPAACASPDSGVLSTSTADSGQTAKGGTDYRGWVVLRRDLRTEQRMPGAFSAAELEDNSSWHFVGDLHWNTEGVRLPIRVDGALSGYEVELIELPYSDTLQVLKLAVYEVGKERAIAYSWAEPGSKNIGINLRWMQAGLKRVQR